MTIKVERSRSLAYKILGKDHADDLFLRLGKGEAVQLQGSTLSIQSALEYLGYVTTRGGHADSMSKRRTVSSWFSVIPEYGSGRACGFGVDCSFLRWDRRKSPLQKELPSPW